MGDILEPGSRVCIIGGGPAGSMAAIHLLEMANRQNLDLEVLIFEPRDFHKKGPQGCNRCAGILSSRLLNGLEELGISLPKHVIQSNIHAYVAHVKKDVVRLEQPNPDRRILSVYRGGGPRFIPEEGVGSFDGFLLSKACERGALHVRARVTVVARDKRPLVHTARDTYPADLVVIATGVNRRAPLAPDFTYKPPKAEVVVQDEMLRPNEWPEDEVNVFFQKPEGMMFGALTPKGRYINFSLIGRGLNKNSLASFIKEHELEGQFPLNGGLCGCTPRMAVRPAGSCFGQRWVAVGDAAVTRLYKDGIGSAFITSKAAMKSALRHGVSRRAFQIGYAPSCRKIAIDNLYGQLLFRLWVIVLGNSSLLESLKNAILQEAAWSPARRIHTRVLWGMFTGDEPYQKLFSLAISSPSLLGLWNGYRRIRQSGKRSMI